MSENSRLREQQQATDRANQAEALAYINSILEAQEQRETELTELTATYRPDETDDAWTREWEESFDLSAREYEQLGGYR